MTSMGEMSLILKFYMASDAHLFHFQLFTIANFGLRDSVYNIDCIKYL